ncbi:hypothetical protein E4631_10400 [Hymenobacter sp. UV11]|uniref:hypothetical protein n=1 Tax=Hymenobacter sp. UV11 TaxID=1849735 RepID=UPI00105C9596|nr:hypothetical protein [Hymenobacter sp. UV11]TDN40562.1 hypothetical protein A8B98_14150 [Hymenobacter sp. UV11]TFZ66423.1 hypothetical protein E4631_10400 [Hymenobacter sp. UV11]
MKRFSSRRAAFATLALFSLGSSTLLTSCFDKDGEKGSCTPKGSTCSTAVTVVDLSKTTGCGLALHLADSTYVVPTGATWTNFHAKAGDKLLVGYTTLKKHNCSTDSTKASCTAGPLVELGCISASTTATTSTGAN